MDRISDCLITELLANYLDISSLCWRKFQADTGLTYLPSFEHINVTYAFKNLYIKLHFISQ